MKDKSYSIAPKLNPEIKSKFRNALYRTEKVGKEHSILICKDKKGNLYPKDICEGEECIVKIEASEHCLPDETQGNFHTHADLAVARHYLKEKIGPYLPKEFLTTFIKDTAEYEGEDITTPSYGDLLNALLNKCIGRTEGTVCVGSDAAPERVDCWTVNARVTKNDCRLARMERMKTIGIETPEPWIRPLFDKERIEL